MMIPSFTATTIIEHSLFFNTENIFDYSNLHTLNYRVMILFKTRKLFSKSFDEIKSYNNSVFEYILDLDNSLMLDDCKEDYSCLL